MPHQIELHLPSLVLLILPLAMILFRLFPIRIRCPVIIAAALFIQHPLHSQEHALRIYFHIYMYAGGRRGRREREHGRGARGYVNFSVKIHFVIMDFPCRIHRCQRRRLCHDTTTSATSPLPWLQPPAQQRQLPPFPASKPRCLMFLGHDRWQVSVGVACKFFFGYLRELLTCFEMWR